MRPVQKHSTRSGIASRGVTQSAESRPRPRLPCGLGGALSRRGTPRPSRLGMSRPLSRLGTSTPSRRLQEARPPGSGTPCPLEPGSLQSSQSQPGRPRRPGGPLAGEAGRGASGALFAGVHARVAPARARASRAPMCRAAEPESIESSSEPSSHRPSRRGPAPVRAPARRARAAGAQGQPLNVSLH